MKIVYTKHARDRILWRGVSKSDLEEAVKNPDLVSILGNGKIEAWKKIRDGKLKVIYIVKGDSIIVITVATR